METRTVKTRMEQLGFVGDEANFHLVLNELERLRAVVGVVLAPDLAGRTLAGLLAVVSTHLLNEGGGPLWSCVDAKMLDVSAVEDLEPMCWATVGDDHGATGICGRDVPCAEHPAKRPEVAP